MNQPADLAAELQRYTPPEGCVAAWWLGQSGFVFKSRHSGLIVVDPYLSDSISAANPNGPIQRRMPPPVDPAALTTVQALLCTHDHADHFDQDSIVPLLAASPDAVVVVPQWMAQQAAAIGIAAAQLRPLRGTGDGVALAHDVRVTAFPAAHPTLEHDAERGHRWLGFLIELAGVRIYHSGDTVLFPELIDRLRAMHLDLLIVPVNGRDYFREHEGLVGNLWPREAADLAEAVGARLTVPCHWDLFTHNGLAPGDITNAFFERHPYRPCTIMAWGERILLEAGSE